MPYRYKCIVEYNGIHFSGWQRQNGAFSVQECIENALFAYTGQHICIYASGRTDAGVHAFGQVIHFDSIKPLNKIVGAINYHTKPHPVSILSADQVDESFHARFSATERAYVYKIITRKSRLVLDEGRYWHLPYALNVSSMREAAKYIIGTHDLTSFKSTKCTARFVIRTVNQITITETACCGGGLEVLIEVRARSFLHNQVRIIVGALVDVGLGRRTPKSIQTSLEAKSRSSNPSPTAPAHGLYFMEVIF